MQFECGWCIFTGTLAQVEAHQADGEAAPMHWIGGIVDRAQLGAALNGPAKGRGEATRNWWDSPVAAGMWAGDGLDLNA